MMVELIDGPTPLQIRQAIVETPEPFLTIKDLADILDVTPRTIRNNVDGALIPNVIESREVGQTTVYYKEDTEKPHYPRWTPAVHPFRRSVLADRAEWQDAKARFFQSFPHTNDLHPRIRLYYALLDYARRCGGLQYTPYDEKDTKILLRDDSRLSESDVEFIDSEVSFFEANWDGDTFDEVKGINGLLDHSVELNTRIQSLMEDVAGDGDSKDISLGDLPEEELNRLFPSAADILYTGAIIDKFTVQLHRLWWSE